MSSRPKVGRTILLLINHLYHFSTEHRPTKWTGISTPTSCRRSSYKMMCCLCHTHQNLKVGLRVIMVQLVVMCLCVIGARLSCRAQNTVGEETGHIKIIYEGNEDGSYSSAPESLISSAQVSHHSAVISSKCKYHLDMI